MEFEAPSDTSAANSRGRNSCNATVGGRHPSEKADEDRVVATALAALVSGSSSESGAS